MSKSERRKLLEETMKGINKGMKDSSLVKFGDKKENSSYISFGIEPLDKFIGGGVTRGTFTVIYGGKSAGKTTLALQQIAHAQSQGLICCLVDLEHGWDKERALSFGVNLEDLVLIENATDAEQAMDIIRTLAKNKVVDLVVVDSVQAMSPKAEQETKKGKIKSIEDDTMALLARKLGQFFRIVAPDVFKAKIAVVMIGQVRTHGIGSFFTYAGLSGGKALEHWMSTCLFLRPGQKADAPVKKYKKEIMTPDGPIKKTITEIIGFDTVIKLEKTKNSHGEQEGQEIHVPFYFESGFLPPLPEEIEKDDFLGDGHGSVGDITEIEEKPNLNIDAPEYDKVTEGGDPKECLIEEPKRKRGRPKKSAIDNKKKK